VKVYEEKYVRIVTAVAWNTGRGILFLINAKAHNLYISVIFYYKARGLILIMHEKHAVATWNGVSHPDLCLKTQENLYLDCRSQDLPDAYWLLASSWQTKDGNPVTFLWRVLFLCG
jgi:hypothetical protein